METCEICCCKPSKITCLYCDVKTCRKCSEKFILSETNNQYPRCMKCKNRLTRDFLCKHFSKLFIDNRLKNHRENMLLESEKSKLPFYHALADIEFSHRMNKQNIEKVRNLIHVKTVELNELKDSLQSLITKNFSNDDSHRQLSKIVKCPNGSCRGYLNTSWLCTLCSYQACSQCYERYTSDHVCDDNILKNIIEITHSTKPCPSCNERICKVDGCDQMWCVLCLKPFSWKTGQMLTDSVVLHNPHFLEYIKTHQLETLEIENNLDWSDFVSDLQRLNIPIDFKFEKFFWITEQLRFQMNCFDIDEAQEFKSVGVSYVLGEIDEHAWKKKLQQIEKKSQKFKSISEITQMFINISCNVFSTLSHHIKTSDNNHLLNQLSSSKHKLFELKDYFNTQMTSLSKLFNKSVVPLIDDNLQLTDSNLYTE